MTRITHRLLAAVIAPALLALVVSTPASASATGFSVRELWVTSGSVQLDTTIYLPDSATRADPAPAVIVAHGFGGSKHGAGARAIDFAEDGYVALAYTARGFGESTGQISVNAPEAEIVDARAMIDLLAGLPEVVRDRPGDPRVGVYGGSYGGGLALLTAAYDDRVDAIVARNTWSSLVSSLFPNAAGPPVAGTPAAGPAVGRDGVLKQRWIEQLFSTGAGPRAAAGGCGRFRADWCAAYREATGTGRLSAATQALFQASSPASVLDRIQAPTLLTQGAGDTLFPLAESDANARGIFAAGTPVKLTWTTRGHGSELHSPAVVAAESAGIDRSVSQWFEFHLRGRGEDPGSAFDYGQLSVKPGGAGWTTGTAPGYPGLDGRSTPRVEVPLTGPAQQVDPTGQAAVFSTGPLTAALPVVGSPVLSLRVSAPTGAAVLFGTVYDVGPDGRTRALPELAAPVRVTDVGPGPEVVTITLPALAHTFPAGHELRLVLRGSHPDYAESAGSTGYQVSLADDVISLPQVTGRPGPEPVPEPGTPPDPRPCGSWWWEPRCGQPWLPVLPPLAR